MRHLQVLNACLTSTASAGTLASAMSGLLLMRVASIFLGSTARGFTFSAELYGGLLIFVGWVLVDTQQVGVREGREAKPL